MKSICVGIDFGTTNTLVAYLEGRSESPTLSRLGRGNDSIPTTVHVNSNGKFSFGDDADDLCEYDLSGYAKAFKLWLGGNRTLKRDDSEKEYSAVELTMEFLKHIREKCEQESLQGHYHLDRAVITIPVSFSPARKADLKRAAQKAGFQEVILVPEPEAAGKAFCTLCPEEAFKGSALIVDWGGGTLDLSLVQRTEKGFKVQKAYSRGDETMGGEVLDTIMWNYVGNQLKRESGIDLEKESAAKRYALRKRIRQAKEKLSLVNEYSLTLPMSGGIQHLRIPRREWEKVIGPQLEKVVQIVEDVLNQLSSAHQSPPNMILLVGGSSKTPRLRELLEKRTSIPCKFWDQGMEAVAKGAVLYANELFPPSTAPTQTENRDTASEPCTPKEEPIYRIPISRIEANLGVEKKLKLGEETVVVTLPSGVREGQHVTIPSQIHEGTSYLGIIALQNDPFLQQRAEQGKRGDQYLLGMSYYRGVGVSKSIKKGITWLKRAAGQGHGDAQFLMGRICFNGEGMKASDLEKGLMWFNLALTNGHPEAQEWIDKCQRLLNSSDKKEAIVVTPYVHYSYLMDHKPFPLYVIGERYSVFLSDVDEQVLSKLYKGRTDVVVRIKKTYDEEECLPYYKKEDFISNQQVNESTAEKNRDSSFFIAFKGGVTCLALLVWVCIVISSGGSGFLSIVPIGGFLVWLWDKSK